MHERVFSASRGLPAVCPSGASYTGPRLNRGPDSICAQCCKAFSKAARCSRERQHIADVGNGGEVHHKPFKADAEARVLHRAEAP